MLIYQTDKWRGSPPIQTHPTLGVIRRPASLLADLPEPVALWAIDMGYAVPYGDGEPITVSSQGSPSPEPPSEDSAEQLALILEFLNEAEQSVIAAVKGISDTVAAKVVKARPLTVGHLNDLLTARQLQSLRSFVEGDDGAS